MSSDFKEELKNLPLLPGCYLFKDKTGRVLYVGKARELRRRVTSYFRQRHHDRPKIGLMMDKIAGFDFIVTSSEVDALILEKVLIKKYDPPFNTDLRDDKSYPYLAITAEEEFPRVFVTRELHRRGTLYFGPYTNVTALRTTLDILRLVYPIRTYARKRAGGRAKPFLDYHVRWALNPGSAPDDPAEYAAVVKKVIAFLEGRDASILKDLKSKMTAASAELEFERAAKLRDKVEAVEYLMEGQKVISRDKTDRDVIGIAEGDGTVYARIMFVRGGKLVGSRGYALAADQVEEDVLGAVLERYYAETTRLPAEILLPEPVEDAGLIAAWLSERRKKKVALLVPRRGEKLELVRLANANAKYAFEQYRIRGRGGEERATWLLGELKKDLGLAELPHRIECFDISTLQGTETVASMVVFENGKPRKSEYRRFRIKWVPGQDDFSSMIEVLKRRLRHIGIDEPGNRFAARPDLIVVDGGKPQLSAALAAEDELKMRGIPTVALAKREEEIYFPDRDEPLRLPKTAASLNVIRHLRDEAHRFAVTYHRGLRGKAMLVSAFDSIPGVGPAKKKALLKQFGSPAGVFAAAVEELAQVPGVSKILAETIYASLH
jgi:excinuclease ABC subunit C